ncbi:glycosyltransferase family 61 protein [Roseovarius sp.]|uniref:glycosyltransferase family 61 protein n=1 Tax=Roseovarius sp. TaxID=1486281 RepID=UPI0035665F39
MSTPPSQITASRSGREQDEKSAWGAVSPECYSPEPDDLVWAGFYEYHHVEITGRLQDNERESGVGGTAQTFDRDQPDYHVPSNWLITPRSYLLDRMTPTCEHVHLPRMNVHGRQIEFQKGPVHLSARPRRRDRLTGWFRPVKRRHEDGVLIDMRHHAPANWAHFLTDHLPSAFYMMKTADVPHEVCKIILPAGIPKHIQRATDVFGLNYICTNDTITGEGLTLAPSSWRNTRSARHFWVDTPWVRERLASEMERNRSGDDLPKRVFISRRDSRRLINEGEVADHLTTLGYVKIYAEDLSVIDQFRVFDTAEEIVAIHGAGLAPLLYRPDRTRALSIMELFPPGHVTFVWRVLAHQTGCHWIGIRGHLRKEHIEGLYDLTRPFTRYSLQDFTIDTASIDEAFEQGA